MSAPGRWLRLDIGWPESEWLARLDGYSAALWPLLLCWVKANGAGGRCRAPSIYVLTQRWRVESQHVETLVEAALEHGAIVAENGEWRLPKWGVYQPTDGTAAARQQAFRQRQAGGGA